MTWNPSTDEINELIILAGEKVSNDLIAHYTALAPVLYDVACSWCNRTFDMDTDGNRERQSAVKLFIANAGQFYKLKVGLISRSMGTVAYSYSEDIPPSVYRPLKPFRKLRW